MHRARLVVSVLAFGAYTACVIGPKQDDPASIESGGLDSGFAADTSDKSFDDAANPSPIEDGGAGALTETGASDAAVGDARTDGATDGDASGDALSCGDGSVPLTAAGPWNAEGKCWKPTTIVFECVDGIDGGAALTCFARVSTGEFFLAPSTHIPSGSDFRPCTEAERATVSTSGVMCK